MTNTNNTPPNPALRQPAGYDAAAPDSGAAQQEAQAAIDKAQKEDAEKAKIAPLPGYVAQAPAAHEETDPLKKAYAGAKSGRKNMGAHGIVDHGDYLEVTFSKSKGMKAEQIKLIREIAISRGWQQVTAFDKTGKKPEGLVTQQLWQAGIPCSANAGCTLSDCISACKAMRKQADANLHHPAHV